VINPIFGKISVFAEPMTKKIEEFLGKVEEHMNGQSEASICLSTDIQRLTLDVLGICILGEDYKFLKGMDDGPLFWYKNIIQAGINHPVKTMKLFNKIPFQVNKDVQKDVLRFNSYIKNLIEKHSTKPSETKSLMSTLIEAINDKSMTYDVVRSNLTVFFLAGHETTSVSLQYCLYNLARHPEYQKKIREEILKQFPDDDLDYEKLKDFDFILNLINETLRMFPPVTSLPGREFTKDTEIEGWMIPKGFQIMINIFNLHFNKEIWGEDANEFRPERFENLTQNQRKAFMPFGGGARICLGMSFSILEQKIFLIKLLKKYELSWDSNHELELAMMFFSPKPGSLNINFKRIEA